MDYSANGRRNCQTEYIFNFILILYFKHNGMPRTKTVELKLDIGPISLETSTVVCIRLQSIYHQDMRETDLTRRHLRVNLPCVMIPVEWRQPAYRAFEVTRRPPCTGKSICDAHSVAVLFT